MNTSVENIKDTVSRLKQQLVASRFLRWWLGELATMAPTWMRSTSLNASSFLLVPLDQATAQYERPESADKRDVALTLPPDLVLRKTLTLPLATQENLRQVLDFQMEQHTPFPATRLYFGYRVTGRDFDNGQLTVEFVATPREAIDAAIKTLAGLGMGVRAVFATTLLSEGHLVSLLPDGIGKPPAAWRHGVNPWLAAVVAVLAVTAIAAPLVVKREAVVQMLPWVETGKKAAEAVDAARRQLVERVDRHNYLLEKRQATPTVIQTLEELTRVLPDDTWVQTLDIKGKELQIQGETASSTRLVTLFEQSSMFREASFRAQLTKGQSSGTERYQLAMQVRPIAPPAIAASAPASAPASAAAQTTVPPKVPASATASTPQSTASAEKKP